MFYIERETTYGNWERFKIALKDRIRAERIKKELEEYSLGSKFRIVQF